MEYVIRIDDLRGPEIAALLEAHLRFSATHSPRESVHALDIDGLRAPEITFWTLWLETELVGCGALKELSPVHGEIKSMHTASFHRRKGVAAQLVDQILEEARSRGYTQVSLETGSMGAFESARALYARFGFETCGPFAEYTLDPNSIFMTRTVGPVLENASRLRKTLHQATPALLAISDADSAKRPGPGKWSPREIIGHLIDSASNNHQRFVRAQFKNDLVFKGYDADAWVAGQRYQNTDWRELVALWRSINLHMAHVMAVAPETARLREIADHNLHEIAWRKVPSGESATLEYFMADYIGHLEHHLRQVLGDNGN